MKHALGDIHEMRSVVVGHTIAKEQSPLHTLLAARISTQDFCRFEATTHEIERLEPNRSHSYSSATTIHHITITYHKWKERNRHMRLVLFAIQNLSMKYTIGERIGNGRFF